MKKSKRLMTALVITGIVLVLLTIINKMYIPSLVIGVTLLIYIIYIYQSNIEGKAKRSIERMFNHRN